MTPAGIEPVTFQFVAQHLDHWATAVPGYDEVWLDNWFLTFQGNVVASKHQEPISQEKSGQTFMAQLMSASICVSPEMFKIHYVSNGCLIAPLTGKKLND